MKTKSDWLNWVWQHSVTRKNLSLERFQFLNDFYQIDRIAPVVIGITGTNGKGSVAKLLELIYTKQGYRAACITSPHIHEFNERLTFDGQPVSDELIVEGFERIQHLLTGAIEFNAFDVCSFILFDIIYRQKVDVAIVECGIGAKLDSIAALKLDVSVITSISLDHVDMFGPTKEQIAFDKAHIAREGGFLVCGVPDVPAIVETIAIERGASCFFINKDFSYGELDALHWFFESPMRAWKRLPRPRIKLQNAAIVMAVISILEPRLPVSSNVLINSLLQLTIPGRFEHTRFLCEIIYDVAANPEATGWLRCQLDSQAFHGKTYFILGLKVTKDLHETLKPMADYVAEWYIAPLLRGDGHPVESIKEELAALGVERCYTGKNVFHHLKKLMSQVSPCDRIVIFGSFQMVAEAKSCIRELTDGITT